MALHPHPLSDPSSDTIPSSPTTSSFYSRPIPPHRAYKASTSSRRPPSNTNSSSPPHSSLRTRTLENARLAREQGRKPRDLGVVDDLNPFERRSADHHFAHGGLNRDGVWEEYSEEEERILNRMVSRDRRRWEEELTDRADDGMFQEEEDIEEGEEPPSDLDALDDDAEPPGLDDATRFYPPHPPSSHLGDIEMDDSPSSSPFSSTPRADLVTTVAHQFEGTLQAAACPACRAPCGSLLFEAGTFHCKKCPWSADQNSLYALEAEWVTHALAANNSAGHLPLLAWTEYTGTLILCDSCDEQFAA